MTTQPALLSCSSAPTSTATATTSPSSPRPYPVSSPRSAAFLAVAALLVFLAATTPATVTAASSTQSVSLRGSLGLIQQQQQQQQAARLSESACERTAGTSPLRLSLDAVATDAELGPLRRFCFRLDSSGSCDPASKCCNLAAASASKVEFDVVAGCKDALRSVTVNGRPSSYMYDTQLSVLRIDGLNASAAAAVHTAGGDQICVFLDASSTCPSLAQLCTPHALAGAAGRAVAAGAAATACRYALFNTRMDCCPVSFVATSPPLMPPPPPPPPVTATAATTTTAATTAAAAATTTTTTAAAAFPAFRSDFPYCQCRREPAGSRLFVAAAPNATETLATGLTRICFDVGLQAACADPASPCCDFALYKMEFEVDRACADSLAYTTIDGVQHVRFFQTAPHAAIKVVNLNRPITAVNGTRVCLFLRPQCNSLSKLCAQHDGTCTVGLFNKPARRAAAAAAAAGSGSAAAASCCPLSTVSL